MVNSNPETVSTDYDTSDKLYFEPLTREDVLHIVEKEKPDGVIVQFGGQTPLNLSTPWYQAGVPILGTQPESIDRAEDREQFQAMLKKLNLMQPANGTALTIADAAIADTIGYPVIVRPSFVLGGRAMKIVYNPKDWRILPGWPSWLPRASRAHRQVSGGGGGSGCGCHQRRDQPPSSAGSWNTSRPPGSTAAIPPVSCLPSASAARYGGSDQRPPRPWPQN
jgi:hypothetical protein